jgi:hypothetical protein
VSALSNITAAEVQVGDLIHLTPQVDLRVIGIAQRTAKMIKFRTEYVRCDFAPGRVGQAWPSRHRLDTELSVTR